MDLGLLDQLFTPLVRKVGHSHDEPVTLSDLGISDEPLKIPGRVSLPASRGRLGDPNVVLGTKHLHYRHVAADTKVPGIGDFKL